MRWKLEWLLQLSKLFYIYIYIVPHQNLYSSIENIENKTISEKVVRKNRHESQDSGRF